MSKEARKKVKEYYTNRKSGLSKDEFRELYLNQAAYIRTYKKEEVPEKFWMERMSKADPEEEIHILFFADGSMMDWAYKKSTLHEHMEQLNKDSEFNLEEEYIH